jgi:hypothetical protein
MSNNCSDTMLSGTLLTGFCFSASASKFSALDMVLSCAYCYFRRVHLPGRKSEVESALCNQKAGEQNRQGAAMRKRCRTGTCGERSKAYSRGTMQAPGPTGSSQAAGAQPTSSNPWHHHNGTHSRGSTGGLQLRGRLAGTWAAS